MVYLCLILLCSLCVANENGFVQSEGVQIHYIANGERGKNPALLFIPGGMIPGWIWEKQLEYFAKDHYVVAMDPRSQGESGQTSEGQFADMRAKDIKAVVDKLQLTPVVLIGWSLAVSEVVAYLKQFGSEGVEGIVLIDGFAGLDVDSPIFKMMVDHWTDFQRDRVKNGEKFVRGLFKQPQTEAYYEKLLKSTLVTPTTTAMTLVFNFILTDYRPTLPAINVPTLVVTIDAPWLPAMKDIQKAIPDARLEIIDNASHALFVDQPDQFNQTLERFLQSLKS